MTVPGDIEVSLHSAGENKHILRGASDKALGAHLGAAPLPYYPVARDSLGSHSRVFTVRLQNNRLPMPMGVQRCRHPEELKLIDKAGGVPSYFSHGIVPSIASPLHSEPKKRLGGPRLLRGRGFGINERESWSSLLSVYSFLRYFYPQSHKYVIALAIGCKIHTHCHSKDIPWLALVGRPYLKRWIDIPQAKQRLAPVPGGNYKTVLAGEATNGYNNFQRNESGLACGCLDTTDKPLINPNPGETRFWASIFLTPYTTDSPGERTWPDYDDFHDSPFKMERLNRSLDGLLRSLNSPRSNTAASPVTTQGAQSGATSTGRQSEPQVLDAHGSNFDRVSVDIAYPPGVRDKTPNLTCLAIYEIIGYCGRISTTPYRETKEYRERLTLLPLIDGKLAAHFSFSTLLRGAVPRAPSSSGTDDTSQHYTIFPLILGQILREHAIPEFHLTIYSGKWDYGRLGHPGEPGVESGAELWAWMGDAMEIPAKLAVRPILRVTRQDGHPLHYLPNTRLPTLHLRTLRHATLSAERVSSENLIAFLNLLPCPSRAGVAALLKPHKIFDADWHDLVVHVRRHAGVGIELVQPVLDPVRMTRQGPTDWSLRSLFDRSIPLACNIATSSVVRVLLSSALEGRNHTLIPEPEMIADATTAVYDNGTSELDLATRWPEEQTFSYPLDMSPLSELSVRRTLKGSSQTHGELSIVIRNNQPTVIRTHYLETMPWHVEFFLHTLSVSCGDGRKCDHLYTNMTYTPSQPHATPAMLQATIELPPHESLHLSLRVRKAFLRYKEHPPDAQRGWDDIDDVTFPSDVQDVLIVFYSPVRRAATPSFLRSLSELGMNRLWDNLMFDCATFQALAASFTFRYIAVPEKRLLHFCRTMIARPDLARRVQRLAFTGAVHREPEPGDTDTVAQMMKLLVNLTDLSISQSIHIRQPGRAPMAGALRRRSDTPQLASFEHGGYPGDDPVRPGTSDATLMGCSYLRISPYILACYEEREKPQPVVLRYDMRFSGAQEELRAAQYLRDVSRNLKCLTLTRQTLTEYLSTSRILRAFADKAPNLTCLAIYENIDYSAGENKRILRVIKEHFTKLQVFVWAPLNYPVARDEDGYTSSSSGFSIDSCTEEEMYSFDKTERYALAMFDAVPSMRMFISFRKGPCYVWWRGPAKQVQDGPSEPRPFKRTRHQ
ncbi:Gpi16 subunit, GPI transamidase component-domain-containing protein [Lactifluus volemus]|nr:Gpi16 subunit, GPI transamidase component-domain-containing protein [Lactifluus volemus]